MRLHIDASEFDHVAFDEHRSDLQEEAVPLAVVVDELDGFPLLEHLFGLQNHVDFRCHEFVFHCLLFVRWLAQRSPPRDELQSEVLKEAERPVPQFFYSVFFKVCQFSVDIFLVLLVARRLEAGAFVSLEDEPVGVVVVVGPQLAFVVDDELR